VELLTVIIEDLERYDKRLRNIFSEFDFLKIIGNYMGIQPYDKALEFICNINSPLLLVIDWDLEEGENNGKKLFESISNKNCYAIFCSNWSSSKVINSVANFPNAHFLIKSLPDVLSKEELTEHLEKVVKPYFRDNIDIELAYYENGRPGSGTDNIRVKRWLCKNIICLMGKGKQYNFLYLEKNKPVMYTGGCAKAGDISEIFELARYSNLKKSENQNQVIWYNELYYSKKESSDKFFINENLKYKEDPKQRIFWTI